MERAARGMIGLILLVCCTALAGPATGPAGDDGPASTNPRDYANTFTARGEQALRETKHDRKSAKVIRERTAEIDKSILAYLRKHPETRRFVAVAMFAGRAVPGMRVEQLAIYCETKNTGSAAGGGEQYWCDPWDPRGQRGDGADIHYVVTARDGVVVTVDRPNGDMWEAAEKR